jgi:hypothetical protein
MQVAALKSNLERVFAPYPGVILHQPFLRFYPDDHCVDLRHLTLSGAQRHTGEIIRWIQEHWLKEGTGEGDGT